MVGVRQGRADKLLLLARHWCLSKAEIKAPHLYILSANLSIHLKQTQKAFKGNGAQSLALSVDLAIN